MAYSVYTCGSQYAETGKVGVYVGTREDNLRECLGMTAAELADTSRQATSGRAGSTVPRRISVEAAPVARARRTG